MVNDAQAKLPAQVRAARALLGWSQERLAVEANLSRSTVKNVEGGIELSKRFVEAIRDTLTGQGVVFVDGGTCAGKDVVIGVALTRVPEPKPKWPRPGSMDPALVP